jgi:trypsin
MTPARSAQARLVVLAIVAIASVMPWTAAAQPAPFLAVGASTRSTKVTTTTFGNDAATQEGTGAAANRQVGRESNPCLTRTDADQSTASATASVDEPAVYEATVSLSFTIGVEADGGKTLQRPLSPPCTAQSDFHTVASAEAFASVDLTLTMSKTAAATTYELRLKDPTGSISEDTQVFYRSFDPRAPATDDRANYGPNPSALEPPFLFEGGPGVAVGFHLEIKARVSDQGFANRRAGGTFGLVFEIVPAPLLESALQLGTVRMIGGKKDEGNDYPAVGAVLLRDRMHCSGTLVAPSTVLTAAHCVVDHAVSQMKFVLGPSVGEGTVVADVEAGDYPKGTAADDRVLYVAATHTADIAVLYLKTPIDRNQFEPAPLYDGRAPSFFEFTRNDGMASFVGFGFTNEAGVSAMGEKRLATMKVRGVTPESFRYGDAKSNTCHGDSGGASFFTVDARSHVRSRVTGVISWGDTHCKEFGVNARTDKYRSWIMARLK